MDCSQKLVGLGFSDPDQTQFIPFRCKTWGCEKCCQIKKRQLIRRISKTAEKHKMNKFLTLTYKDKDIIATMTPSEQHRAMTSHWNLMKTAINDWRLNRGLKKIKFIWVIEPHLDGYFHMHVLLDCFIPREWLQEHWGFRLSIEQCTIRNVSAYLTKYLAKSDFSSFFMHKMKRYQFSYGIETEKVKKAGWLLAYKTEQGTIFILENFAAYWDMIAFNFALDCAKESTIFEDNNKPKPKHTYMVQTHYWRNFNENKSLNRYF